MAKMVDGKREGELHDKMGVAPEQQP